MRAMYIIVLLLFTNAKAFANNNTPQSGNNPEPAKRVQFI